MASIVRRARDVVREDGLVALATEAIRRTKVLLRDRYWDVRKGTQSFTIAETTAIFAAPTSAGGDMTRRRIGYERPMLEDFLDNLRSDDVVFDVGANIGLYSCFASKGAPMGTVFAFEPYPPNYEQLRRNAEYNGDNTVPLNLALSDTEGTMNLQVPGDARTGAGNISVARDDDDDVVSIESVPGDALVESGEVRQPNVVKIDVEGAEPLVIEGMKETLGNAACRLLYCEVHLPGGDRPSIDDYGATLGDLERTLESLGFDVERLAERADELQIRATKSC